MNNRSKQTLAGSPEWNDHMFAKHPTPYSGIAGWIERRRLQTILKIIRRQSAGGPFHLLEIGCEAGHLLQAVAQAFPQATLTGFDISKEALKMARTKLPDTTQFIHGDITDPPEIPANFHFILCSETLEHIPNFQAAVAEIAKLAGPDTLYIFTVPLESLKNKVKRLLTRLGLFNLFFRGIEQGMSEWHVNDFSKREFVGLLETHFEVLQYYQIMGLHQVAVCKVVR